MNAEPDPNDVDSYIAAAAPAAQPVLREIRRIVKQALPQAQETISYKMPAFRLQRTFLYFAAFKRHVGVYPPVTQDAALAAELRPFANDKGNLGFPLDQPMPYELIARVAVALAKQYQPSTRR
ncbi:iron chaperone [Aquabacterium sp.]|uniref:iron chaperone n=1 Tax=Aquabacterium sp. TaxID=1872578 RepID=UPI002B6229DD|nr:DUF1801 domain-containing protein [Aquabacterium sp.]HSW06406.1 DUF1801 domain-containing protein [Aquabacterium sp.]